MVQSSQTFPENREHRINFPVFSDPSLLSAAQRIYRSYYEANPSVVQRPIGIAINRLTYRGKLIFSGKPVLLPQECFVPFSEIESELH